jgi:MerR family transcriptional regulator, copper efflux regulator
MHTAAVSLMRIGELARQLSLSPDTLRHYERLGLLACARRTPGGFRLYAPDALRRVRTIQAALALGFSLRELATLLRARASGKPPCRNVRRIASERLNDVERELERLGQLRDALREVIEGWDVRLAGIREGEPAFLLDSLADVPTNGGTDHGNTRQRPLGVTARLRARRV